MTWKRDRSIWLILSALCLTVLVYWPSLHGGYIFDDMVYFVDNTDVHVTTLNPADWIRAALQQAGTTQFRALSMLSFALNYYFTGLDPFWPKLTNLGIHLLNGFLLWLLLKELLRWRKLSAPTFEHEPAGLDLGAAILASAWLLLPINLTGVAYVAQRMESLANLFVFLGLFAYIRARRAEFTSGRNGMAPALSVLACTALGFSAKESAILLPLYTACLEFAICGFRNADHRISRSAVGTHVVFLGLPLLAGLAWISSWVFSDTTSFRTFSIGQRLLTEPRVLMDYIGWTLFPNINTLTFYHDDLKVSERLFDPPTTALAIAAVFGLIGLAVWQRRARPLFCLGILWFFAGHMLTGTVIPLELVFEHRNYFPSAGLLLAVASLLALEPGMRLPILRSAAIVLFIGWCTFTTFLRSEEWSDPLRLAYAEALKRPDSERAQYGLASTLIRVAGDNPDSPLIQRSTAILEHHAFDPDSGIGGLQALIFLNGRAHRPIDPRLWKAIVDKLRHGAPSQTDIAAVIFLFHCQQQGVCPDQPRELLAAFTAALESSDGNPNLMSAYADFAVQRLNDPELAVRMSRAVVDAKPEVMVYRANLIRMLIRTGKLDAARIQLQQMRKKDIAGSQAATIETLGRAIDAAAQAGAAAPVPEPAAQAGPGSTPPAAGSTQNPK